jgi:hypothetical protein
MDAVTVYHGEWLTFCSITKQAHQFLDSLRGQDWDDFVVAATILETSLRTGRPPAGRAARINGSKSGLFELRITPPRRKGPKLRLLYVRQERRILCARGITKRYSAIRRHDIELADEAVAEYRTRH